MNCKTIRFSLSLLAVVSAVFMLYACEGCNYFATPTPLTAQDYAIEEVLEATKQYNKVVRDFIEKKAAGEISEDNAANFESAREQAWKYLAASKDAAYGDRIGEAHEQLKRFKEEINVMREVIEHVSEATTVPAD